MDFDIPRFWLNDQDNLADGRSNKRIVRKLWANREKLMAAYGFVPYSIYKKLVQRLGSKKGKSTTLKICKKVVETIYAVDCIRVETLKEDIKTRISELKRVRRMNPNPASD